MSFKFLLVPTVLFVWFWFSLGFIAMIKHENILRINRSLKKSKRCRHTNKEHRKLIFFGLFSFIPTVRKKVCRSLL